MKYKYLTPLALALLGAAPLMAQISFSKQNGLLIPDKHYSGVAIAVLDMNGDGRDDIVRLNQGVNLSIEYQTGPGRPFRHQSIGTVPDGSQWGICVADIDNNGIPDVLTAGYYDGIKVAMANADGSAFTLENYQNPETFGQGVNFADIDGDLRLDAFICHDDGPARVFLNTGNGQLSYAPATIDLRTWPPSDDSGNYGSVWSDINKDGHTDLYIAKCRTGVNDAKDGRRINQLFLNNGDGTYAQDTANLAGLRIGAQSWTADFGDIDNDGDFDCFVTNHDESSQLLLNDGSGHFTDITQAAGLFNTVSGLPVQGVFRDFDNDGYVDILVAGTQHFLFHNNQNKTFSAVPVLDNKQMESFALGDLNTDGFQDIYAGYAELFTDPSTTPDALWFNTGNANHYFGLNLRGVQSNRSAIGAKVFLFSALGTQIREVRSGESYGIMNSTQVHFGMGQLTQIDSVRIHWPSGLVETLQAPALDQYLTVEEGKCVVSAVRLLSDKPPVFCSGDSIQITAPPGFAAYSWSTGESGVLITVKNAGNYEVTVTTSEGCTAASNVVATVVDPAETPKITAQGDTVFCAGSSVILTSSPASAYLWSTGATSPSIEVSQPGVYFVTIQGLCATFMSTPQTVTVLEAPLPVPVADTVAVHAPATLSASGDSLFWFDAASGGNLLFTGNPFVTPALGSSTVFWVANNALYDVPNKFTGMTNHMGSNFASAQTNGKIIFDCFSPCRLATVKVYANVPGIRKIDLRNAAGEVLQSASVNIPTGTTTIPLGFDIPVGEDLELGTDPDVNMQSLGSVGPQLRRSDQGVAHPYVLPGYVSIKTSNFGVDRYYYFYHWEIDLPATECLSPRVPVTALVDSTLVSTVQPADIFSQLRWYPNPTHERLFLEWQNFPGGNLQATVYSAAGIRSFRQNWNLPAGAQQITLNLETLSAGVYWLQLESDRNLIRQKLILY